MPLSIYQFTWKTKVWKQNSFTVRTGNIYSESFSDIPIIWYQKFPKCKKDLNSKAKYKNYTNT